MALLSAEHLAGPGYIILNILRVINIITLSSVVASSVVMLVKTFIVSKFFFFDATSHVVTALAGMFLVVSECSLFRGYFARNWPLLSPSHGFVTLGCSMTVLGLNMLGNMNKEATSQKSLGLPFWRLLLASGILAIVIGFFNVVASFVFRDKARNITARRVRSKGAITLTEEPPMDWETESKLKAFTISTHHTGTTARTGSPAMRMGSPPRIGTPPVDMGSPQPNASSPEPNRFSQFDFNPLRAFRTARQSVLPSYHSGSPSKPAFTSPGHHRRSSSLYSRSTSGQTKRSFWLKRSNRDSEVPHVPEISAPLNVNPQFAHLVRPNLAHHPSVRRPEADFDKI
ncbi:hypothetical protein DPSP01_009170 [Paraphaeosphaeria sporulosa]|uniref:DUF7598 domain-containing protein n=1 Tax=Paraphaeosphaeria sporulosa TaxID=1460663 RepID=A0A177CJH6_9PLEO|nr:uncharacterized protein CC84DRAFT_1088700 [Paraphaeosphaeria sporulosa]OAG07411.1 hypothetical protein CC84DRAFT_1088700 [Paraphaeosphaeria sporulosa]